MQFSIRETREGRVVYREVNDMTDRTKEGMRRGLFTYMKKLKDEANKEILRKPKSGRVYIRRDKAGRKRRHVASAPGETHANMSGRTRRSLSWKVFNWERAVFGYGIATSRGRVAPPWAPYLEDGTKRMAPRPSLGNAIDKIDGRPYFNGSIERAYR